MVLAVAVLPAAAALLELPMDVGVDVVFAAAVVIAVAADLATEATVRAEGSVATVGGLHRVYAVQPAIDALAASRISARPRALRYRSLFQFFAPFAPIELLVPAKRATEAEQILERLAAESRPGARAPGA